MKKNIKKNIGIITFMLLIISQMAMGATIIDLKISESTFTGGSAIEWAATNNYIEEIVVLRTSPNEAFTVDIPEGPLMRGWHTAGERNEYQRFDQIISSSEGISFTYGGSLDVRDYQAQNYNVRDIGVSGNRITMSLQSKKDSVDRPTYYGNRKMSVSSSVPDGRYIITTSMSIDGTGKVDTQRGVLVIRSLPTISIEDINFGYYGAGERISLMETSPISIRGGTAGERFSLFIEGINGTQGRSIGQRQYLLNLKNPNGDEEIPVSLFITGISDDPVLETGGNANATLEARVDARLPTTHGTYSGRAKIIFQYD